jgi:tRNA-(ms[2]io[6]A)-hydroxylase
MIQNSTPQVSSYTHLLMPINSFLKASTPDEWTNEAKKKENLPVLLTDHLLCELKAAQSAMFLIRRYAVDAESAKALLEWLKPYEDFAYKRIGHWKDLENLKLNKSIIAKTNAPYSQELIDTMVLLIKEELHHFYQVLEMMDEYQIPYENISSSRYAKGLLQHVKTHEPNSLIDKLICGAYIEARSCERFAKIAPYLDSKLGGFYVSLLRSESRHYQDYLKLANDIAGTDISERINFFGEKEAELILNSDSDFKFHSGLPI